METTTLVMTLPTLRPWSVPATSVNACPGVEGTTAPLAGTYGSAMPVVAAAPTAERGGSAAPVGKNAAAHGGSTATSFGAHAAAQAGAFGPAALQARPDARIATTLDPGSPPRDARLL